MKISLFGYGKTNKALSKRLATCDIYDDSFQESSADSYGNRLLNPSLFVPENSELEVATPGIPPHNSLVKSAKNLVSEYDVFAASMPFSIWISGTNGKTTTTEMLQSLLAKHGSECGGNIGTPLAELSERASMWILETSSFTLHYTRFARPNLYILLPLSEDHIFWHGSYEAYVSAKLKPLKMMRDKEIAFIPSALRGKCEGAKCEVIFYEDSSRLAKIMGLDTKKVAFSEPFLLDSLLALSAYKVLFGTTPYEEINGFKIGAHKIEEFYDSLGRLWVDDSKATNVDASIAALKRYATKRVRLVLGGDDKGADLTPLFEFMRGRAIKIYAIGSNAQKLAALSQRSELSCEVCELLDVAVARIKADLTRDEVALLSPAAASLDQFSSYKERGEKFQRLALL